MNNSSEYILFENVSADHSYLFSSIMAYYLQPGGAKWLFGDSSTKLDYKSNMLN
jgi:hypothetical protein